MLWYDGEQLQKLLMRSLGVCFLQHCLKNLRSR